MRGSLVCDERENFWRLFRAPVFEYTPVQDPLLEDRARSYHR